LGGEAVVEEVVVEEVVVEEAVGEEAVVEEAKAMVGEETIRETGVASALPRKSVSGTHPAQVTIIAWSK
jgi:hypothetical protein